MIIHRKFMVEKNVRNFKNHDDPPQEIYRPTVWENINEDLLHK